MGGMLSHSVALVNAILMLHADAPLTVAEIAKASGLKYTPAESALGTLEKRGLVLRMSRLDQDVFEVNRDDPHYPMAYGMALVDAVPAAALKANGVYAAFAYGSLARPGGGTANSDLDLLLVGDIKDRSVLMDELMGLGVRLHRRIDPFVLSPEQFERARAQADPQVAAALSGVRIMGSV